MGPIAPGPSSILPGMIHRHPVKARKLSLSRSIGKAVAPALRGERLSPEETVRRGWNRLSWVYRPDRSRTDGTGHRNPEYAGWLRPLLRDLPPGAHVLDLGCGCGDPVARWLSQRFYVTGIDISDVQIRRAQEL